jgi:capsular exopolysaccharide synthesis family protein
MKKKEEFNLLQLVHIIYRRKLILFTSLIIFFSVAVLYNIFSNPVYESFVIIKKDEVDDRRLRDEMREMFQMQTMDELETVIEVIKTRDVLERVINELQLVLIIDEIKHKNGDSQEYDTEYFNYLHLIENKENNLLRFIKVEIDNSFKGEEFHIKKSLGNEFEIYSSGKSALIERIKFSPKTEIVLSGVHLVFEWPDANVGDMINFEIRNMEEVVHNLQKLISISRIGTTNLAKLSVESLTPRMAQMLANTIIKNYREVRLEQKRQTIHYSYSFVNSQLKDIEKKLQEVESELGQFKSDNQIVIIEESSKDIIEFSSNLENEKLKVELELVESKNKLANMRKELGNKGYFDQTYLTPQSNDRKDSPFTVLMEQLSDAELKRIELLQKRKDNHPEVIAMNDQINQIKSKLEEYNQNTLTSYEIIVNTLEKKLSNINRLIRRYSKKLENLPNQEQELVRLVRNKNVFEKMFTMLLDKREEFRVAELSKLQDIIVVDSARVPLEHVRPRKLLNMALAIIGGLFFGLVIIFSKEIFDRKITKLEEIEEKYPFPILTIIQKYTKLVEKNINNANYGKDRFDILLENIKNHQESFRLLDIKLQKHATNSQKSLLISSCEENTGKTSIAISYAIFLVLKGEKVLLIDCDLRKKGISKYTDLKSESPGLIDLLNSDTNLNYILKQLKLNGQSNKTLDYIPSGGLINDSGKIFESKKFKLLIENLSAKYNYIIIDTPPLTKVVDTLELGKMVNDLILVVRPNHTYKDSLELAIEDIKDAEINVLGFIINAVEIPKFSHKYKYGYGYGYPSQS